MSRETSFPPHTLSRRRPVFETRTASRQLTLMASSQDLKIVGDGLPFAVRSYVSTCQRTRALRLIFASTFSVCYGFLLLAYSSARCAHYHPFKVASFALFVCQYSSLNKQLMIDLPTIFDRHMTTYSHSIASFSSCGPRHGASSKYFSSSNATHLLSQFSSHY